MGAKGLSGEGYEGHSFWDTEMYTLPFFIYTNPEIARKLLMFRYNTLDKARDRAKVLSIRKGACFPWRTINGEEASAYFLAGTCQFHINAAVAYSVHKYVEVTSDIEFLVNYGAEILVETARFWVSFGQYIETKGNQFCINGVTGPDEFSVLVNNNCYTNLLARENMLYAYETIQWLKTKTPDKYRSLCNKIGLSNGEPEEWKHAADHMYIPFDKELGVFPQDDSFLYKKPWDIENTPEEAYPLLDKHHPVVVYRHQVSKQADLLLALYLLSHKFNKEEMKTNYDFYEKVTVHESSLSACIFSIVANSIDYHEKAYDYFVTTARLDLDDFYRNTKAGIHGANMAGTWMSIVNGFAGMRAYDDILSFSPYIPEQWEEYSFKIGYRGNMLKVLINKKGTKYELIKGDNLVIMHDGQKNI